MVKIPAGRTRAYCGETIRITSIDDDDPDEQRIVGATGKITHPFPGLMLPSVPDSDYIAGIYFDPEYMQLCVGGKSNLLRGDTFEVIDHSTAESYPDSVVK